MSEEKKKLTHPILGVRSLPKEQADTVMADKDNGGWEWHVEDSAPQGEEIDSSPDEIGQNEDNANTTENVKGNSKKAKTGQKK